MTVNCVRNIVPHAVRLARELSDRADDRQDDQRKDQAIFNGSRAALRTDDGEQQTREHDPNPFDMRVFRV